MQAPFTRNSGSSLQRTLRSVTDRSLQDSVRLMEKNNQEMNGFDDFLRASLKLPTNRTRGVIAKVMHYITPSWLYAYLPIRVTKLVAEESDVLELLEGTMRKRIDNQQESLVSLAVAAAAEKEQLGALAADIKQAREENWDALRLHEFMMEHANVAVRDEISRLLSSEFDFISDEDRETRREELLGQLEKNIEAKQALAKQLATFCSSHLGVFHRLTGQYFDYVQVYRPIQIMRDSAKTSAESNQAMYAARDALAATIEMSVKATEAAMEAARLIGDYSISAETQKLLESGHKRLEAQLKLLNGGKRNFQALSAAVNKTGQVADRIETVEAVTVS